jgi:hypothetical protein
MFRGRDAQGTENFIIGGVLAIAVVFSLVSNLIQVPVQWQIPFIFLALFAIFKLVYPMAELVRQVNTLSSAQTAIQFKHYPTNSDFYNEVHQIVRNAQYRISVTYIRRAPPSDFASREAKAYFDFVLEWAKNSPNHTVRRIICVPDNRMLDNRMLLWAQSHYEETKSIPNYEVRVVESTIEADALNLALIDNMTVFLAFSGETEQDMRGLSLKSDEAFKYFDAYYNQLWAAGKPLSRFLEPRREGEPIPAPS